MGYLKNPLKLHKIPAYYLKFSQTEIYVFHFAKKARFVRLGVNGTTFLQDIQRKKSGEKKQKEKKCQTKKCPALLILLYFLPLITGPYDLTIASEVSVLELELPLKIKTSLIENSPSILNIKSL